MQNKNGPVLTKAQGARGFTLAEVLVALLVLSIGLLGAAGLQLASLRSSQDAYLRSQASILALDMIERMRANRDAALAGEYDIAFDASPSAGTARSALDLQEWRARIADTLPDGKGAVSTNHDLVGVTIRWNARHDGADATDSFEYETRL